MLKLHIKNKKEIMKVGFIFFIILILSFRENPVYKSYEGHMQKCSGNFAVDRKWELQLFANNTFTYKVRNADTKKFIDNRIKSFYSGKWVKISDTLILNDTLNAMCTDKVLKYIVKDSFLISLGNYIDNSWGFNNIGRPIMKERTPAIQDL
jgi:hypothetical protein